MFSISHVQYFTCSVFHMFSISHVQYFTRSIFHMFSISHRDPSTSYMHVCTDTPKLRHRNLDFTFVGSRIISHYLMILTDSNIYTYIYMASSYTQTATSYHIRLTVLTITLMLAIGFLFIFLVMLSNTKHENSEI